MIVAFGWVLLVGSIVCGVLAHETDVKLQNFREVHVSPAAFRYWPVRLKAEYYHWSAAKLVRRAWFYIGAMFLLAALGGIVLVVESF